jgi:hypothetical protein
MEYPAARRGHEFCEVVSRFNGLKPGTDDNFG